MTNLIVIENTINLFLKITKTSTSHSERFILYLDIIIYVFPIDPI